MKRLLFFLLLCYNMTSHAQAYIPIAIDSVLPITDTMVGQYKKFEVAVSLNQTTNTTQEYNYFSRRTYAIFSGPNGEKDTVDGFWYWAYNRCDTCYNPTTHINPWTIISTVIDTCNGFNTSTLDSENGPSAYLYRLDTNF